MWIGQAVTALIAVGTVTALLVPNSTLVAVAGQASATVSHLEVLPGHDDALFVEDAAIGVAGAISGVLTAEGEVCPIGHLEVRWSAPGPEYRFGAFIEPVGPPPGPDDDAVNGVVVCADQTYSFMGFQAHHTPTGWSVLPIPEPDFIAAPRELPPLVEEGVQSFDVPVGGSWTGVWGADIEGYAAYIPQQLCHPAPKPGMVGFARLVLRTYPASRNYGIARECTRGGVSEHKEGRAWDWGVHVSVADERLAADEVVSWLMATDEYGNRHAMARRLGVMYIIWNSTIWTASRAYEGWRPYVGPHPHDDHVHLSLNWDGALGRTSFWAAFPDGVPRMDDPFGGTPSAFPDAFIEKARERQEGAQEQEHERDHADEPAHEDEPMPGDSLDPEPDEGLQLPDAELPDAELPGVEAPELEVPDLDTDLLDDELLDADLETPLSGLDTDSAPGVLPRREKVTGL